MKAKRKNTLFKHYSRQVIVVVVFLIVVALIYVVTFGLGFWFDGLKDRLSGQQREMIHCLNICCCLFPILLLSVFRVLVDVSESGKAKRKSKQDE